MLVGTRELLAFTCRTYKVVSIVQWQSLQCYSPMSTRQRTEQPPSQVHLPLFFTENPPTETDVCPVDRSLAASTVQAACTDQLSNPAAAPPACMQMPLTISMCPQHARLAPPTTCTSASDVHSASNFLCAFQSSTYRLAMRTSQVKNSKVACGDVLCLHSSSWQITRPTL